jgi:hypothetical protein
MKRVQTMCAELSAQPALLGCVRSSQVIGISFAALRLLKVMSPILSSRHPGRDLLAPSISALDGK